MPAFGNIILPDGQGTPVNHTFAPTERDARGVYWWADRSGGIPLGYPVLSALLRRPVTDAGSSAQYRDTWQIRVPTLEVTSPSTASGLQPVPTVAYNHGANIDLLLPSRGSLQERKNINAYTRALLAHAVWTAMSENLEGMYG